MSELSDLLQRIQILKFVQGAQATVHIMVDPHPPVHIHNTLEA